MLNRNETVERVVKSLNKLSEDDLQFIARIAHVLETQDTASDMTEFDDWAMELARRNKFDQLYEEQVAELVHEYRQTA